MTTKLIMNKQTLFSIIIPVYNTQAWLDKCLNSVVNQDFHDFEVLLIDDGSTDASLSICKKFANNDKRIRLYSKNNEGLCATRKFGIERASGKYILYVDSDDWVKKNFLRSIVDVLNDNGYVDMIIFNYCSFFSNSKKNNKFELLEGLYKGQKLKIYQDNVMDKFKIVLSPWRSAYKRDMLLQHYCKDYRIVRCEDYAFTFEYFLCCESIYFLDKVLYNYNCYNEKSIMATVEFGIYEISLLGNYMYKHALKYNNNFKNGLGVYFIYYIESNIIKIKQDYKKSFGLNKLLSLWKFSKHASNSTNIDDLCKFMLSSKEWDSEKYFMLKAISQNKIFSYVLKDIYLKKFKDLTRKLFKTFWIIFYMPGNIKNNIFSKKN